MATPIKKVKLYYFPTYAFILSALNTVIWYGRNMSTTWKDFGNALEELAEERKVYHQTVGVELYIFHTGIVECIHRKKPPRKVRRQLASFGYHPNKATIPKTKVYDEMVDLLKTNNMHVY